MVQYYDIQIYSLWLMPTLCSITYKKNIYTADVFYFALL